MRRHCIFHTIPRWDGVGDRHPSSVHRNGAWLTEAQDICAAMLYGPHTFLYDQQEAPACVIEYARNGGHTQQGMPIGEVGGHQHGKFFQLRQTVFDSFEFLGPRPFPFFHFPCVRTGPGEPWTGPVGANEAQGRNFPAECPFDLCEGKKAIRFTTTTTHLPQQFVHHPFPDAETMQTLARCCMVHRFW